MGHSARELYHTLLRHDVSITPKPFAMGFRCVLGCRGRVRFLAFLSGKLCTDTPPGNPGMLPCRIEHPKWPPTALSPLCHQMPGSLHPCRIEHPQELIDQQSAAARCRGCHALSPCSPVPTTPLHPLYPSTAGLSTLRNLLTSCSMVRRMPARCSVASESAQRWQDT